MGNGSKGDILFHEREYPPFDPPRERFDIASEQLEELQCLPIALPIARRCRVECCYTICLCYYYPLPLCPSCRSTQ